MMFYFDVTFTLFSVKYYCEKLPCEKRTTDRYCKKFFTCDVKDRKFSLLTCAIIRS